MTNRLTNKQASMFNDILKTYNNAFFKDLPNKEILEELEDIINPSNFLNIAAASPAYTTTQLNNFVRNIINFDIKTFDNLKNIGIDTNMEFVGKTPNASTYGYNINIKDVIIDKLNIINVFVDLLDAYKYCIDNENNSSLKSGYSENVAIESIQIVANTTRLYTSGSAIFPAVSDEPNAGYIKKVKVADADDDTTAKITLFLSIQSFNAGFMDLSSYDKLFEKTGSAGTVAAGTVETLTTTNFLSGSGATHPSSTDTSTVHYLNTNTHHRQTFLVADKDTPIPPTGTRDEVNVKTIKMFLRCLISIDPALRKQTVYALYYYYNFLQLYSTLIINICNVMFADVRDTANKPFCIETINTTYNQRKSRSVSGVKIKIAGAGYTAGEIISFTDSVVATDKVAATFTKLTGITAVPLTNEKLAAIITTRGTGYTTSDDISAIVKKMSGNAETTGTAPAGAGAAVAVITTIIVPVAMSNITTSQDENINKLQIVYNNVIESITLLQREIIKYGTNNNLVEKDIDIVTSSSTTGADGLEVKKSPYKNVIISLKLPATIEKLEKLDRENDLVNNYYVYDNIRKYSYNILVYNNKTTNIELTLDAFFNYEDAYPNGNDTSSGGTYDIFKNSNNKEFTDTEITASATLTPPTSGKFLSINRKDLNSYRIDYNTNKQSLASLNENIDMNERIYNNQINLYEVQFNKNTFLNRQVLIFNIIICIIVLILIIINVVNIDKEHIKNISLACLGIILLLLVIYYISNITYIETFQTPTTETEFTKLKRNYAITNTPTFASSKYKILDNLISGVNIKFSSYFEKINIVLPSVDTTTMYREIKDTTQSESDKKKHIEALLLAKRDQSLNNMNALKYELDNNKLYILTLLISSIIFIGLYNIYINYITEDKYVSLMIFLSFIIFIVILSYYIINSNRQVRSTYKNIYWGPELSTDF